jgi:thiol:disulfide interchange protein DsbA
MMPTTRRRLLLATALVPALSIAHAQPKEPVALRDYRDVKPAQPVDTGNKIEVLEFFQYSCPHCYAFNPDLDAWRKKLAPDVEYRRVHINWDNSTLPHTKIYYSLEQLGRVNDVHEKVFNAIHAGHKRLLDPNEIADLMAANGIDRKQWLEVFNSFSIATKANKAMATWKAYKIDGTPTLACDGRYLTSPSIVGSRTGSLAVLDGLIQRTRAAKAGGAKK